MKKIKRILPLCSLVSLLMVGLAGAAEPSSHPSRPIATPFGPAGLALEKGKVDVTLSYQLSKTDGVRLGDREINNDTTVTNHVVVFEPRFGLATGLDIRTSTPISLMDRDNVPAGNKKELLIGDTELLLHKVMMDQGTKKAPFSLALEVGGTIPTGENATGNRAWGAGAGVGITYFFKTHRFDQELNYRTFAKGEHDLKKPDSFRCSTSWAYALHDTFDIGAESLYEWSGKSKEGNTRLNDMKREWYVGPKVAFNHKATGTNIGALVTFPVVRTYDTATPSDNYRFDVRLSQSF